MADRGGAPNGRFGVDVVYARPDVQVVMRVELSPGATLQDAVRESGLLRRFPEIDRGRLAVGVYGRPAAPDTPLRPDDRVEIYRPLVANPKEMRRRRAKTED
jgi:putative ubiquitin-RnfH superfamily antitoxin RatB of RatAB toxin-antitoxin module